MKKTFLFFSCTVILLISIVLAGCAPTPPATGTPIATDAPVTPGDTSSTTIPETVERTIQLDPATVSDSDSITVSSLVYEGLVALDADGNPQAALAVNWTVSDDQLDYVISLRPDVFFHSGNAFNADAVLANFNRWFDPANPLHGDKTYSGWAEYFLGFKGDFDTSGVAISPFDGVEKVDNQTILIHLNRPLPEFLTFLALPYFAILDPAILESGADMLGTSVETVSGTGAYSISAWDDAGLALTPNSNYWGELPTEEVHIGWK